MADALITLDNLRRFKELLDELLKTVGGKSAYEVAVVNGFKGTESEWLSSLKGGEGAKGDDGLSAYESAKLGGYTGTLSEFYTLLATLDNIEVDIPESIYKSDVDPDESGAGDYQFWLDTSVEPAQLKYKNDFGIWQLVAGGGGGGGGDDTVTHTVTITPEWNTKTIAYGNDCILNFTWESMRGGSPVIRKGSYALYVVTNDGEEKKESYSVSPTRDGEVISVNLTSYLTVGDTDFVLKVTDGLGKTEEVWLSVRAVKLSLTKSFDESKHYAPGEIKFHCTPSGAKGATKYMYILLDDKVVIDGEAFTEDNETKTYPLIVNTHGKHSIRAYFACKLTENGDPILSEEIYSEFAVIDNEETTPVIITNCNISEMEEFDSIVIGWRVFTPNGDGTVAATTPLVQIYENNMVTIPEGLDAKKTVTEAPYGVMQEYVFKAEKIESNFILFKVGDIIASYVPIYVNKGQISIKAATSNLQLYLSPRNQVQGNDKWVSDTEDGGKIEATLSKFNFESDGWITSGKNEILRLMDEATLDIPVKIFTNDVKTTGITVEFDIATNDVLDYETEIIRCMNSGIGITVSANQATLKTKQKTITTPFREGEQVRVSFVIESVDSSTKLLLIYINGVLSGATNYNALTEDFAQSIPQGITVGSKYCTTDIYAIRVYSAALSREHILNNWIADTQDRELLLERYRRNNIFDDAGILPDNLPEGLPYMVFYTDENGLPQVKEKGAEKYLNGKFVDPVRPERCFTFTKAKMKVQGTSSAGYPRKNFTMTFSKTEGIVFEGSKRAFEFQIDENSVPTNSFCFKADYASSEGANNVELVKLFNDICPVKTPPQDENPKVRQGIDGFPMVIFCYYDNTYYFIGKYNFNNDKSTPEVFGMTDGVESWEVANNGTAIGEYKEDDLDTLVSVPVVDKTTGETTYVLEEKWRSTFEARYPEDYEDVEELQEMVSWVRSTNRKDANPKAKLSETVIYGGKSYEYDTVEYRQAKFINEASRYFNVDHLCFYYLYTSFFLMVDNREKNTFPTRYLDGLWYFIPYDFDTAIGINNSGELIFGHGLEDIDAGIFNGAESVLWCNVRDCFADRIETMYTKLRNDELLTYDDVVERFTKHQRAWGEAIFNEDSYYKYIAVMLGKEPTTRYLPMLQGSKEAQRNYWLYNRFKYYDSKYVTKDALANPIIIRPNKNADIVITPYADAYFAINFDKQTGNYKPIPHRAYKGVPVSISNPIADPQNAVVHIYNSSMITDLGDLSGQDTSEFDGRGATRLQRLVIGSDSIVNDKFRVLSLGSNKLLKLVNVKNCPLLTDSVDISGCSGIEEAYFEGTNITSLALPRGGSLRVLHLPKTVNNLTVINHKVTDFSMTDSEEKTDYSNLSTLWLELNETSKSTFDLKAILNAMLTRLKASEEGETGRLRVTGFELTGDKGFETAAELLAFYRDLRENFRGMDANGNAGQDETYLRNMLKGKIEIKENPVLGTDLEEMKEMFPEVEIIVSRVVSAIYFYEDEAHTRLFYQDNIYDNGDATNPAVKLGKTPTFYAPTSTNNGGTEDEYARYVWKGSLTDQTDETGWSDTLKNVTVTRRVHALYRRDLKYKRTFLDKNGNIIKVNDNEVNVYYAFEGENNVIEPPDHADYTTEENGITWYHEFIGWTENNSSVQASKQVPDVEDGDKTEITYVPAFFPKRVYKVNYYDETTLLYFDTYFNEENLKTPPNPTKASDNYNYYEFSHWELNGKRIDDFSSEKIEGTDMNIQAIFIPHTIYYTVRFKKYYGEPLQTIENLPYSTEYSDMYTGDLAWMYSGTGNLGGRSETLSGWRVTTSSDENRNYYLDYTAILSVEEKVKLSVRRSNDGQYNTGSTNYVCDANQSTERGFNIGVRNAFQIHHYIDLRIQFANDLPKGTVFNDVKIRLLLRKDGYQVSALENYNCRFACYMGYYADQGDNYENYTYYKDLTSSSWLINEQAKGNTEITLDKKTQSSALSFMTNNLSVVNRDDMYIELYGSCVYVREVYCTLSYTT